MVEYKNECVDCGLPCLGSSCVYARVPHYYCDICEKEIWDDMIESDGDHYHEKCYKKQYPDEEEDV